MTVNPKFANIYQKPTLMRGVKFNSYFADFLGNSGGTVLSLKETKEIIKREAGDDWEYSEMLVYAISGTRGGIAVLDAKCIDSGAFRRSMSMEGRFEWLKSIAHKYGYEFEYWSMEEGNRFYLAKERTGQEGYNYTIAFFFYTPKYNPIEKRRSGGRITTVYDWTTWDQLIELLEPVLVEAENGMTLRASSTEIDENTLELKKGRAEIVFTNTMSRWKKVMKFIDNNDLPFPINENGLFMATEGYIERIRNEVASIDNVTSTWGNVRVMYESLYENVSALIDFMREVRDNPEAWSAVASLLGAISMKLYKNDNDWTEAVQVSENTPFAEAVQSAMHYHISNQKLKAKSVLLSILRNW